MPFIGRHAIGRRRALWRDRVIEILLRGMAIRAALEHDAVPRTYSGPPIQRLDQALLHERLATDLRGLFSGVTLLDEMFRNSRTESRDARLHGTPAQVELRLD